jgi:phosphatidylglycerol:prolipoprotein diacylglycerol transferase
LVASLLSVITIDIPPTFHVGPLTLAWHGITIAIGIAIGGLAAVRYARERGLPTSPLTTIGMILIVCAIVGGRAFYLAEHGQLGDPSRWLVSNGFTFDGGFIAAAIGIAAYLRISRQPVVYLDLVAAALPLGVAIGRIGDVINGEHYGAATTFFLGVRNANPDALTPRHDVAYHSGGLYEVLLATMIFAIVWPLRHRLVRATALTWLVLGLFSLGRFFEFFARSDSEEAALGLNTAQWTSLVLLAIAAVGASITLRQREPKDGRGQTPTPRSHSFDSTMMS